MIRVLARLVLGVLVVLQSAAPALASDGVVVDDSCGCALECGCCEPIVMEMECEACGECASEVVASEDCGCSSMEHAEPTTEKAAEPVPAETKKPESTQVEKPTEALPPAETPAPTLEKTETELPPAPIAVPTETAPAASSTDELFPGPATTPPADVPAAQPQAEPKTNTDGLFDEPAATVEEPAPEVEETEAEVTETEEAQTTEDLFVEPSQPAVEETKETESETIETETEDSATESDPLDDLFGPSTPAEEPAPKEEKQEEAESNDPFSWNEAPALEMGPSMSRTWTDNEADIHCEARLVRMTTTSVFLSQESGELVELEFAELSDTDLNFVREQIRAQRALLAPTHLAARPQ